MERVEEEPARKMIYGRYVSINFLLYFPTKFTSMLFPNTFTQIKVEFHFNFVFAPS